MSKRGAGDRTLGEGPGVNLPRAAVNGGCEMVRWRGGRRGGERADGDRLVTLPRFSKPGFSKENGERMVDNG